MYKRNAILLVVFAAICLLSSAFACSGDNECGSEEYCSDTGTCQYSRGLPLKLFYPYGDTNGDARLDAVDDGKESISLSVPVIYNNRKYDTIYVGVNGLVSFGDSANEIEDVPFDSPAPSAFPVPNQKFVAPYWLDLDASGDISDGNAIYFRETQDGDSLKRASKIVREAFSSESDMQNWEATSMTIITWYRVGTFPSRVDKLNTFQAIVATDGTKSFTQFLYGQMSAVYASNRYARIGINFAPEITDQVLIELAGSGSESASAVMTDSNCDVQGLFVYAIDQPRAASNKVAPLDTVEIAVVGANIPLIVGLVVGLVGAALIAGAIVAFFLIRRARRSDSRSVELAAKKNEPNGDMESPDAVAAAGMGTTPRNYAADGGSPGAGPAGQNTPPVHVMRIMNPIKAPTTPVIPRNNNN
jgi:hypothetical protein